MNLLGGLPVGSLDLSSGIFIQIFDCVNGVSGEAQIIHYPEHPVMVSGVES